MQILVPVGADARVNITVLPRDESPPPEPYQLSFLSPLPGATAGTAVDTHETGRLRRRRVRCITKADVENANAAHDERAPLRASSGEILPPLFTRHEAGEGEVLKPADAATIINSAESLLAYRGVI
jgi:hypothetical protein